MIQTIDQLKAAFGDGKFPTLTNWEDLIDTIFSMRDVPKIYNIELNAYDAYTDTDSTNIGGFSTLRDDDTLEIYNAPSAYSPIPIDDIIKRRGIENQDGIAIIHNDGAFYYEDATTDGEIYIKWTAKGSGSYWDWYASDTRYYEWNQGRLTSKPQIVMLPLGCSVAFARSNGGWQPIGNTISYDYDTLMQKVQENPKN